MSSAERSAESSAESDVIGETTMALHERASLVERTAARYDQGQTIGRYVLLGELGAGGMSVVYAAYDPELDRKVAIKVLLAEDLTANEITDGTFATSGLRLLREAQALAKLSHPNVLPVFDVGVFDGRVFLAMEHVDGCTLAQWLKAESRPWREVVAKFLAAGRGLAAAHTAGFIHRDFKPHNVLVSKDGAVRVMDFGLVRRADEAEPEEHAEASVDTSRDALRGSRASTNSLTVMGAVLGTPAYMAPEQHRGATVDARADQYAFCAALYQGLYGQAPFAGGPNKQVHLCKMKLKFQPLPPGAERRVPRWLRKVILRGLQANPQRRWPSMQGLLLRLEKDPRKTMVKSVAASSGLSLALAGGWAYGQAQERQAVLCSGAETHLLGIWDAPTRARIGQAFHATKVEFASTTWQGVDAALDRYAGDWAKAYRDTCEATQVRKEQSLEVLDLRMACLNRHLLQLEATTRLFTKADAQVIEHAVSAVSTLPSTDDCNRVDRLQNGPPPAPEHQRQEVEELRKQIAEASALEHAGKYPEALPLAERAFDAAKKLGYTPLIAEIQFRLGLILAGSGQYDAAVEGLAEASLLAKANGQDDLSAEAQTKLIMILGHFQYKLDDALRWTGHAEAAVARLGPGSDRKLRFFLGLGIVHATHKKFEEAEAYYQQALEELATRDHEAYLAGELYTNLANCLQGQSRDDEAIEYYKRAEEIFTAILGDDHPTFGVLYFNLGGSVLRQGRATDSIPYFKKAEQILEAKLGSDHPHIGSVATNLGTAMTRLGEYEGAKKAFAKAERIYSAAFGPGHWRSGYLCSARAALEEQVENIEAAAMLYRQGHEILWNASGSPHPDSINPLFSLATLLIKSRKLEEAEQIIHDIREKIAAEWPADAEKLGRWSLVTGILHAARERHLEAIQAFEQGISSLKQAKDLPDKTAYANLLVHLARSLRAESRDVEAIGPLEEAIQLFPPSAPEARAEARFELAQAVLAARKGRIPALDHAKQALADYRKAGKPFDDERDAVARWIASN